MSDSDKTSEAPPVDGEATDEEAGEATQKKGLGLVPMIAAAVVVAGVAGGAAFVLTPGAKEINPACLDAAAQDEADEHGAEKDAHGEEKDSHGAKKDSHGAKAEHGEDAAPVEECPAEEHGDAEKSDKKEKKEKKKKDDKGHGGGDESASSNVKPLGEVQHTAYATFLVMEPMVVSIAPIGRSKHLKISLVLETDDDGAQELLEQGFYVQDVLNTFLRSVDNEVLEDPSAMSRLRAQILRRVRAIAPDANVQNVLITEFVLT